MRTLTFFCSCLITVWLLSATARGQVVFSANGSRGVGAGATINANFISDLNAMGMAFDSSMATTGASVGSFSLTGLNQPRGALVLGNTLYVVARDSNSIGTNNATTGAVIDSNFITGLFGPSGTWVIAALALGFLAVEIFQAAAFSRRSGNVAKSTDRPNDWKH